jgi:disulfide bond formation protein DsbB
MDPLVAQVTNVLAVLVVASQVVVVGVVLLLWLRPQAGVLKRVEHWLGENSLLLAFLAALGVTAGSLFYSGFAGFEPCSLCWWQRVFFFPQVIILALAWWWQDRRAASYCLWLSLIGSLIAVYHYYGQMFNTSALPCQDPSTGVAACAFNYFVKFGYITIPLMSLTGFLLIVALLLVGRRYKS